MLKPLDILVIVLAAALTVTTALMVYSGKSSSLRVIIRGSDKSWVYPLDTEAQVDVPGPLGETRVEIHDGHAAIVSSPCVGQTCVAAGEVHKNGQWVACLPNRVVVLIEGTDTKSPLTDDGDAIDASVF